MDLGMEKLEQIVSRGKRLRQEISEKAPGALERGLEPYIVRIEDLVKRCESFLIKWYAFSEGERQSQAKKFRKEALDLDKELARQDKELARQDKALALLETSYKLWQKRLNSLQKKVSVPIGANRGDSLSPSLQKQKARLLKEQTQLIKRGKALGVEPYFDKDGWLTG